MLAQHPRSWEATAFAEWTLASQARPELWRISDHHCGSRLCIRGWLLPRQAEPANMFSQVRMKKLMKTTSNKSRLWLSKMKEAKCTSTGATQLPHLAISRCRQDSETKLSMVFYLNEKQLPANNGHVPHLLKQVPTGGGQFAFVTGKKDRE